MIKELDSKEKENVTHFWTTFHITMAIDIIAKSWDEVTKSCLNGVWKKIWPEAVQTTPTQDITPSVVEEIVKFAKSVGFDEADEENFELYELRRQELTNEELVQLLNSDRNEETNTNVEVEMKKLTMS